LHAFYSLPASDAHDCQSVRVLIIYFEPKNNRREFFGSYLVGMQCYERVSKDPSVAGHRSWAVVNTLSKLALLLHLVVIVSPGPLGISRLIYQTFLKSPTVFAIYPSIRLASRSVTLSLVQSSPVRIQIKIKMHISLPSVLAALVVASEVSATMMSPRAHHSQLARRINRKKRCLQRTPTASPSQDQQAPPTEPPPSSSAPPETYAPAPAPAPSPSPSDDGGNGSGNNGGGSQTGTIQNASGGPCGDPNASSKSSPRPVRTPILMSRYLHSATITTTDGPNGQECEPFYCC
jgi:hypothetical protein